MFKTWRGKVRNIVARGWNRFRIFWLPLSFRKKLLFGGVTLVVLVGIIFSISQLSNRDAAGKPLQTPDQAMQSNLQELLATPPSGSASEQQQADYYNRLSIAQADAKNYKAAAAALTRQAVVSPNSMEYTSYIQLAMYYHTLKQDNAALQALDKAAQIMPSTDNPSQGYYADLAKMRIDKLREEYKS